MLFSTTSSWQNCHFQNNRTLQKSAENISNCSGNNRTIPQLPTLKDKICQRALILLNSDHCINKNNCSLTKQIYPWMLCDYTRFQNDELKDFSQSSAKEELDCASSSSTDDLDNWSGELGVTSTNQENLLMSINNNSLYLCDTNSAVAVTSSSEDSQSDKKLDKPKRRRIATVQQRKAANIRERRRMCSLNAAFNTLRRRVPAFAYERRLSRIETLRLAITYIQFMTQIVQEIPLPQYSVQPMYQQQLM